MVNFFLCKMRFKNAFVGGLLGHPEDPENEWKIFFAAYTSHINK